MKSTIQTLWRQFTRWVSDFKNRDNKSNDVVKVIIAVLDEKHDFANRMISQGGEQKQLGLEVLDAVNHAVGILKAQSNNDFIAKEDYPAIIEELKLVYKNDCQDLMPDKVARRVLFEEILIKTNAIEADLS